MHNDYSMVCARSVGVLTASACALLWTFTNTIRAAPVVSNVDLSGDEPLLAAAVPVVAVDPAKRGHIAVAWRFIDPLGGSNAHTSGNWVCHLSTSVDNGKTFNDQVIEWGLDSISRCNAPWTAFSKRSELYFAATLTETPAAHADGGASSDAAKTPPTHPNGTDGFIVSHDGGRTWSRTASVIPGNAPERFETDASIPAESKQAPWDGARGAIDLSTGAIYISGAYPARPGGSEHSQRFYGVSVDGGKSFGPIRAFATAAWPERWDGDIAAANGEYIAAYIADSTPDPAKKCPCAVVAVSHDGGKTQVHQPVADADDFDLDTLVHYPEIAADPAHKGRFALVLVSAQKTGLSVFLTTDEGKAWHSLAPAQPEAVSAVTRPALAFSPSGVLVLAWRAVHADGSYDIYAAASVDGKTLGRALRVSSETSRTPGAWRKTYAVRGDFHTSIAVDDVSAHIAWADARNGRDVRAYYAQASLHDLIK